MPPNSDRGGEIDTSNPWIVIPYFPGDQGRPGIERPLTLPAIDAALGGITWLCPSIIIEGVNYTPPPGTYLPDEPLAISVDVVNLGIPSVVVTVTVSWANPSTGIANASPILASSFPVAGRSVSGPTRSPKMIWTPEQTKVPPHFCLLAQVTTFPLEPVVVPSAPAPVFDRHWAQHNLQSATLSTSTKLKTVIWAGNPLSESAAFTVNLRPVSEAGLKLLARVVKAEPVPIQAEQFAIGRVNAEGDGRRSAQNSVVLELDRGSRQPLMVSSQPLELSPHQFAAIELVQTRINAETRGDAVTGSLGIVVFGSR